MIAADRPAKVVTRRELRAARRDRAVAQDGTVDRTATALARAVPEVLALLPGGGTGPVSVAVYVSLPGEPGTGPLRGALREAGHQVLLPVLLDDLDLDWVEDRPPAGADPLRPTGPRLGRRAVTGADVVLVPALAVDATGTRLGQGGGSYDRALARLPVEGRPLVLAVVHEQEVLAAGALPREPHDVGVDGVLTPAGVRLLAGGGGPRRPAPPPPG